MPDAPDYEVTDEMAFQGWLASVDLKESRFDEETLKRLRHHPVVSQFENRRG